MAFKCRVISGHLRSFLHSLSIWRTWKYLSSHLPWNFLTVKCSSIDWGYTSPTMFLKSLITSKIRILKFIESFCHNLIFVAVTSSEIHCVLCLLLSLVVCVYGVQLLVQLRPILGKYYTIWQNSELESFWESPSLEVFISQTFFTIRMNFSIDFLNFFVISKTSDFKNYRLLCHILVFALCVYGVRIWSEPSPILDFFTLPGKKANLKNFNQSPFLGIGNQSFFIPIGGSNYYYNF